VERGCRGRQFVSLTAADALLHKSFSTQGVTMRYVLRQKIFSFGDDFTIKDEQNQDRYFVDGKAISIGDRLVIEDMQGNQLIHIKQKVLSFGKTYEISRGDQKIATVKKKHFTLFRDVFDVEDAAAGDLDAEGDFFDREYRFTRDGKTIARVSKQFFSFSDTYGIDINQGEDDVMLLAVAVVIDQCSHDD
jgi:uncharacterized protein YxjI